MANIQSRSRQLLKASVSANTHLAYKNAISAFNKFRTHHGLGLTRPAPVKHIVYFISSCFEKGYSPATIHTYCSGISFYQRISSLPDPTNEFIVQKLLAGCRNSRKQSEKRAPISCSLLTKICETLPEICINQYESLLFKAAFTLAYFGLLRVSELVFTTELLSERPLQSSDISFDASLKIMYIQIRKSKTNQSGKQPN